MYRFGNFRLSMSARPIFQFFAGAKDLGVNAGDQHLLAPTAPSLRASMSSRRGQRRADPGRHRGRDVDAALAERERQARVILGDSERRVAEKLGDAAKTYHNVRLRRTDGR
jgi:hypothetical protein